jgi:hypothetical protein
MKVHRERCRFSKKVVKPRPSLDAPLEETFEAKAQRLQKGVGDSQRSLTMGETVMSTHKSNLFTFEMELAAHLQDQPGPSSASSETRADRVDRTKSALYKAECHAYTTKAVWLQAAANLQAAKEAYKEARYLNTSSSSEDESLEKKDDSSDDKGKA